MTMGNFTGKNPTKEFRKFVCDYLYLYSKTFNM
jgi:hypothetical protein